MNNRPVPFDLGPVHFIGIGGIGMSGIAEIMIRIGYTVQGSDAKSSRQYRPAGGARGPRSLSATPSPVSMGALGGGHLHGRQGRQSGDGRRARSPSYPPGAPGRDAGRADAAAVLRGCRQHPWQDHDHLDGGRGAGRRQHGPHRGQRRHHQRLWHQRQGGRGRLDRCRGRRERRLLPQVEIHRRGGDQYRPRTPRPLGRLRGGEGS